MIKRLIIGVVIFLLFSYYMIEVKDRRICKFGFDKFTISEVRRGQFTNWIPQTATPDTSHDGRIRLKAFIDQLYLEEIYFGMKAFWDLNGQEHLLTVEEIHPQLENGRFFIILSFPETLLTPDNHRYRVRIQLTPPREALLVPVGGFYKDTGGNWIYVVDHNRGVKRKIKLGDKNSEYFTVIHGLNEGEKVITSPYDRFHGRNMVSLKGLKSSIAER